jgi:hypothetical protein
MNFLSNIKNWFSWKLIDQLFPRLVDWFQTRHPRVYALIVLVGTTLVALGGTLSIQLNQACDAGVICNYSLEAWIAYVIFFTGLLLDILAGKRSVSDIKDIPPPPGRGE